MKWSTTEVVVIVVLSSIFMAGVMYISTRSDKCDALGGAYINGYCLDLPRIEME